MFSVELDAELDDDKYMKEENNIIVHTKPNIDSQVHRKVNSLHIGMFIFEDFLIEGGWYDCITFVNLIFLIFIKHWISLVPKSGRNKFFGKCTQIFLSNLLNHLISVIA